MTLPFSSVGFWLPRRAELTPNRVAIETPQRSLTYEDMERRTAAFAGLLASAGVAAGDRVATLLGNGPEYAEVLFACARLGAILVPLSQRLAPAEIEFMVDDSGATTIVYGSEYTAMVDSFRNRTGIKSSFVLGEAAETDVGYEDALANTAPVTEPRDCAPDDVLGIFYTSGTTGRPKGAMLTHGNFFWTNLNILLAFDFHQDERSLMVLPMFHLGGWNVNTLSVWLVGGTVFIETAFDAGRALDLIESKRITSMMGVPTIYQMIADHPAFATTDLSSVRSFICGGAPLPLPLIRRYQERRVRFIQGYGLTEAAPNCLALAPEDAESKAGAAGRPYFFADVKLFGPNDEEVGPGGTGEVVVGGPSVMKGYWNLPEETAQTLRGGWLRTGDIGHMDDDGYITIVDRVKDMYISGGENVYPAEVEKTLASHPAVAEAAVIGVPDPTWGESGRAIVVLRPDATATKDEIVAFCTERLAKFKVPAEVVFTNALPRNPTGKLLKPELRTRFGGSQ
ncbi:MAG: long-chain fatty acid--CoA ligase [Actinomycetota bacterium]|nr:long-chain fatty acid--CoA ligase [Actinomycetota bacterium]